MQLDYDVADRKQVEADVENLLKKFPELGGTYRMEQSKSGNWHVVFPKSMLDSFDKCLEIAKQSRCDKDWLNLCEHYGCFAIVTAQGEALAENLNLKPFPPQPKKHPIQDLTQPVILTLYPETPIDRGRLTAICQAMTKDPEWQYKIETPIHNLKTRIRIGCRDTAQAKRRLNWLMQTGIKFKWEIIEKK
jgi:hypothetical protein